MNIVIPEKFFYDAGNGNMAYTENEILYINGRVNFDDLMYTITYSVKGYEKCFYCGKALGHNKRTIDHMYPRVFGGISIPNNMVPSCSSCNSRKSCLTTEQFLKWNKLEKPKKEKAFKIMVSQNQRLYKQEFILPKQWITDYTLSSIIDEIDF